MTLPVPLVVRVGNRHITRQVSALTFREEVSGVQYIKFRLARPLDSFDTNLATLNKVYVQDGRTAETVAEGRLFDPGRSVSAGDGQQWDMSAFGPAAHASDRKFPYIVVDTRLEPWRRSEYSTKNAATQNDERPSETPTLLVAAEEGKTIATTWMGDWIYRAVRRAGMKLARVRCDWDAGATSANYEVRLVMRTGSGAGATADSDPWDTAGGTLVQTVGGTNFANGDDVASLRAVRLSSAITGAEAHWCEFWDVAVRALLLDKDGSEITTGYTTSTVLPHEVVKDLLGRWLDQFDGASATVDTSATYQIDQMAYPDGVDAAHVFTDLMALVRTHVWWAEHDKTGNGYDFHWEPWPTTVRYEATLEGGANFPQSAREVYNIVWVRWRNPDGQIRTTRVPSSGTEPCVALDNAEGGPLKRSTIIDAADEIGSLAGATRFGENFLAEHNAPANAGTLNISGPIRDLIADRMVEPWQIRARELIRVRGVESYPDALNASSNDGVTVFRILSKTYDSDTNNAALELDTHSRSTARALARLARRRNRKR